MKYIINKITKIFSSSTKQAEEDNWQVACSEDSIPSYEYYLFEYPNGKYAQEAKNNIEIKLAQDVEEKMEWKKAFDENRIDAYSNFCNKFPKSKHVEIALEKVSLLKVDLLKTLADAPLTINDNGILEDSVLPSDTTAYDISKNGKIIAAGDAKGYVSIFKTKDNVYINKIDLSDKRVIRSIFIVETYNVILVASFSSSWITLIDLISGQFIGTLFAHGNGLALSNDKNMIASYDSEYDHLYKSTTIELKIYRIDYLLKKAIEIKSRVYSGDYSIISISFISDEIIFVLLNLSEYQYGVGNINRVCSSIINIKTGKEKFDKNYEKN